MNPVGACIMRQNQDKAQNQAIFHHDTWHFPKFIDFQLFCTMLSINCREIICFAIF